MLADLASYKSVHPKWSKSVQLVGISNSKLLLQDANVVDIYCICKH